MDKERYSSLKIRNIIIFLVILCVVFQVMPIFINFIVKTRVTCDTTECSFKTTVLGHFTLHNQQIGKNQISNFSTLSYRIGQGGSISVVYLNTIDGKRHRMYTGNKKNAQKVSDKLNKIVSEGNIDITY